MITLLKNFKFDENIFKILEVRSMKKAIFFVRNMHAKIISTWNYLDT